MAQGRAKSITSPRHYRIVFEVAKKMVEKTPDLQAAFNLSPMANAIVCQDNHGSIQPINAKASTQDGLNPHLAILDELHAHPNRELFDVLKSARGARKNPLSLYITTAGYNVEGVCYEQRTLLTKILEGVLDAEHYFGLIYTLDEGDEPLDSKSWIKANPNLNVSVQAKELKGYAEEARYSPDSMGEFKTKRCNVWTSAKSTWLNMEEWKQCQAKIDLDNITSQPCWGGLDLASVSDITAFVLAWNVDGKLKTLCRFYVPESIVEPRTRRGNVPYQRWVRQGYLTTTPGDVTDYAYVQRDIEAALNRFNIQGIGFDPWNAFDLVNRLTSSQAPMIEFRQGPKSFNAPMKSLSRHIKSKTLIHDDNPVLAWMASNLVARKDLNENLAPDKKHSQEKIDGIVALLMALGLQLLGQEQTPSVYEARGMVTL